MERQQLVLVVGGTRGTGLLIVSLLLERGYRVRVLARKPGDAAKRLPPDAKLIGGDITKPETLFPAVENVNHIIFTAGVHSGRIATENFVKKTDYQGVLNTLQAARRVGFSGRFLYLNSIGISTPSPAARLLNFMKGNTLVWRRRAEEHIRSSGLNYTIIRVGFLLNRPGGRRTVEMSQGNLPLAIRNHIARADVAGAFVEALRHHRTKNTTFEIIWGKGNRQESWDVLLNRVNPD